MKLYTQMPELLGATRILNEQRLRKADTLPTLIYFWSMSCSQCKQTIGKLEHIHALYGDRVSVRAIHMPREERDYSIEQLKNMIHELQLTFPIYVDHELKISDAFQNHLVPAYYFFDEKQQLRFSTYGFISTKSLQRRIERIIY